MARFGPSRTSAIWNYNTAARQGNDAACRLPAAATLALKARVSAETSVREVDESNWNCLTDGLMVSVGTVGHSTGGGEVVRCIARHGANRVVNELRRKGPAASFGFTFFRSQTTALQYHRTI